MVREEGSLNIRSNATSLVCGMYAWDVLGFERLPETALWMCFALLSMMSIGVGVDEGSLCTFSKSKVQWNTALLNQFASC